MAKGTEIASAVIILAGLALCMYPLAVGYVDSLPALGKDWSMAHNVLFLGGGFLTLIGVLIEYRAEQVELTRVTRSKRKGDGGEKKVPMLRDAFIVGWSGWAMLLLPIGVAFYYAELASQFNGLKPGHALLFGFYLGAVIALPLALWFSKKAVHQGGPREKGK